MCPIWAQGQIELERSRGVEAFTALIRKAPSLLDFTVAGSLTTNRQGSVEERVRCVEEVLALLQKLNNPVEKAAAIRHVADRLGMEEKVLLERYRSLPRKASTAGDEPASQAESLRLPRPYRDILQDRELAGNVAVPARDLLILSEI